MTTDAWGMWDAELQDLARGHVGYSGRYTRTWASKSSAKQAERRMNGKMGRDRFTAVPLTHDKNGCLAPLRDLADGGPSA